MNETESYHEDYPTRLPFLVAWNNQNFCRLKLRSLWGFMKGLRSYPSFRERMKPHLTWESYISPGFHGEPMARGKWESRPTLTLQGLKAWDFHDPIVSMQKICVTFTLGDEFNRMKYDVEMIWNTSKHIENHCFFCDIKSVVFWCFPRRFQSLPAASGGAASGAGAFFVSEKSLCF